MVVNMVQTLNQVR